MTALPAWIDPDAWDGFVEMRLRQEKQSRGKIVWTARAEKLVLAELYKLHDKGHDASQSLDQSVKKGWSDVYAPSTKDIPNMNRPAIEPQRRLTPEEHAAQGEIRKRVMSALKIVRSA